MPCELKGSRGLGISKRVVLVLEKAFLGALLDLYHPNDIFLVPARSAREAAVPQRAGYRRLLSIQCTRTVCWSSLADCSASALLLLGGFGLTIPGIVLL